MNSDCSTDEELTISELVSKSRMRDKPTRGRLSNRDSPVEPNYSKLNRRQSGSNESPHSEEIKTRMPRENKREANKKDENTKKLPERTKRGTLKGVLTKHFLIFIKNLYFPPLFGLLNMLMPVSGVLYCSVVTDQNSSIFFSLSVLDFQHFFFVQCGHSKFLLVIF